ncbi:MAG: hypothetical protein CMC35_02895 [Flavobacteriaceae bacterium]|nr:hypothetical protein [Flavobacteriaceae bacterium]|tara:strand:- start:796 stop:1080 length:285 start_codon:yes stop_codon:yes gene_type:complete
MEKLTVKTETNDKTNEQETSLKWWKAKTSNIIAIIGVTGAIVFLIALLFIEVPSANKDIINFLSGSFFATILGGIVHYLFGYGKNNQSDVEKKV